MAWGGSLDTEVQGYDMEREGRVMDKVTDGSEVLKRRQWEVFCAHATGYAGGDPITATEAYMLAYPKSQRDAARANAARLAARPEIAARCRWMRQELNEAGKMDVASIRAKVVGLRLEVIDRTRHTKNKHLALQAARDLDKMLGLGEPSGGVQVSVAEGLGGGRGAIESITVNVGKLLQPED